MSLRWDFDDGSSRQIDCHFYDKMPMGIPDRHGYYQMIDVILRAANPLFYDPTMQAATFGLGGGANTFVVPTPVPTDVGASTIDQTRSIVYPGSFQENPVVLITGPITDCVVHNSNTNEKLDFTGYTIAAGVTMTVDTRYGYKTVTDSNAVNQIANLTDDSNLATFHLAADPDVGGGANSIRVTGSAVTAATEIYLQYYNRYVGI